MKQDINKKLFLTYTAWNINDDLGSPDASVCSCDRKSLFLRDFNNFGRLDAMSKALCASLALLLRNAELYPCEKKLSLPLFFANPKGALYSDIRYFNDFLAFDETAGRANLFVYTLPTSPPGEASVHFGITGEIIFICSDTPLSSICRVIEERRTSRGEKEFLVGIGNSYDNDRADVVVMLFQETGADKSSGISTADIMDSDVTTPEEIRSFILEH